MTLHKDDGSGKLRDEVKNFTDADKILYFEVELDRIVTNSTMRMEFTGVNTSSGKDQKIGNVEGSLLVANSLSFKVPVTGKLAIGQYRGVLFVGDNKLKDIDFMVEPAAGPSDIKAGAVTLLRDDGKGDPGEVVQVFKPSDKKLHFSLATTGANSKPAKVQWQYRTAAADKPLIAETEVVMNDSTLTGYLSWKESAPVAKYTAEVLVNGKSIKTFDFEVADPTAAAVTAPNSARFADAKPVSSKTNLVQVLVPGDWAVTDTSAPDEATMDFLAPDNTGYYAVSAFKVKTAPDAAALRSQLDKYLDGTYKTDTTYKGAPSTAQDDGSGRKLFTLNVKLTDGVVHPFVGQASIKFSNGVLVLRRMMVEKTVLESNRDAMGNMTDYLKIATPAASAPASAAAANDPIAMDDMGTYSHPSGAFSISVPKAWKVLDESANGSVIVNFVEPGARAFYGVEALKTNEAAAPTQDALKTALGLYFTKAYGDKPNLRTDQVQFPSEGVARMTFAYDIDIQGHTTRMVGAVYLLRQGASVSFLRSVAPSSDVTRLRDAFNTVGYSYRVVAAKLP